MVEHPIAGVTASLAMVTKGGLHAITRSLAMEYAKQGIRFNTVAPGVVNTPMHETDSNEFLKTLSPMGEISEVSDIGYAIVYLTEARHVTGQVDLSPFLSQTVKIHNSSNGESESWSYRAGSSRKSSRFLHYGS